MEKLLERNSTEVSVVTAALLVISVSYDFGNLSGLSLSFKEVPITLADHARSAVLWILPVGSALVVGSAAGMYLPSGGSIASTGSGPRRSGQFFSKEKL